MRQEVAMLRASVLLFLCTLAPSCCGGERPRPNHYVFVLPSGYVGWIQVIFNDSHAAPLGVEDHAYVIKVSESGIARTSDMRVEDARAKDQFYYRPIDSGEITKRALVPSDDVLPGFNHGGFGTMDTGGKGQGYSWFIFLGPPQVRAKVPLADWDKVVEKYRKEHDGNSRVEGPPTYPIPGRMELLPLH